MLISYKYKNIELNDGLNYVIPLADQNLDDRQSVDESYAYRHGNTPLSAGITQRESTIVLNISIIASSSELFDTKLKTLKQVFDTTDSTYYPLSRKLPYEQYYRSLDVAPRQFTVNRIDRKVTISLSVLDRRWRGGDWIVVSQPCFADTIRLHDVSVSNSGSCAVEPIIEITPLTIGSDGPQPMYYANVTVYAKSAQHILNTPIRLVTGWNTSSISSMRSDGLDITVTLPDGTTLNRYVTGTQASRTIWCKPQTWPEYPVEMKLSATDITATQTTIEVLASSGDATKIPTTGKIAIQDEVITYTGVTVTSERYAKLTGVTRGVDGTTAAAHYGWTWVRQPVVLAIRWGYVAGYAGTAYTNDVATWPVLDYLQSTNALWLQSGAFAGNSYGKEWPANRPFSWRLEMWCPGKPEGGSGGSYTGSVAQGTAIPRLGGVEHPQATWERDRIIVAMYPPTSRMPDYVGVQYSIVGGNAPYPTTTVELYRTMSNYLPGFIRTDPANPYGAVTNEQIRLLHTHSTTSNSATTIDTGWQNLQTLYGLTHVWLWVADVPTDTTQTNPYSTSEKPRCTMVGASWMMDWAQGGYPLSIFDPTVRGLINGEFPVIVTIQNLTDVGSSPFRIWPRQSINEVVTYDCENYTVSGDNLASCTYELPRWLRLLPGTNVIRITGETGSGEVLLRLKWKTIE